LPCSSFFAISFCLSGLALAISCLKTESASDSRSAALLTCAP
jgi:hypothetical protein